MIETLKQSSRNSAYVGFFGEDEIVVSEILLDLPNLVSDSEWCRHFPNVCWGKKRKRSVLDSGTAAATTTSTSPGGVQPEKERCVVVKVKKTKNKNVDAAAAAAETAATSPSTPLAFPTTSESDEHKSSKQSNSKKRTREELLEMIDGLNHHKELLKGELITMRSKHYKLSTTNLELKAKKQELSFGQKTEKKAQLGINREHYQMTMFAPPQQFHMDGKSTGNFQHIYGQRATMATTTPYHGMTLANQIGPRGIPDLNVCAEETNVLGAASSQPLDMMRMLMNNNSRFRAADARRRRMMKIKEAKKQGRSQSQSQHHHHGPLSF